MIGNIVMEFFL